MGTKGSKICEFESRFEVTGSKVSNLNMNPDISSFFLLLYRAVKRRKNLLCSQSRTESIMVGRHGRRQPDQKGDNGNLNSLV